MHLRSSDEPVDGKSLNQVNCGVSRAAALEFGSRCGRALTGMGFVALRSQIPDTVA
jgi:hypothetical protein